MNPSPPASGESAPGDGGRPRRPLRWWPALVILALLGIALIWIRSQDHLPFQKRNLQSIATTAMGIGLLLIWWVAFSRARWKLRVGILVLALAGTGLLVASFRIAGVDGDLLPILEPRWAKREPIVSSPARLETGRAPIPTSTNGEPGAAAASRPDFPQFLGAERTAIVSGPALHPDWKTHSPAVLWRQPIGAGWSGFVVVGELALTQEQRGEEELVTCYEVTSGRLLWSHADPAHYQTTIAGEGPRCTPTVAGRRVFTLGATGWLNCLELETGRQIWQRRITDDAGSSMPDWGFSGSPLVRDGRVYVSAGGKPQKSMIAYEADTGRVLWMQGNASASHSSPFMATLAGRPQLLMFNSRRITAHDPVDGKVLWEFPWGVGQPHVAVPVVVGTNRVVFSSGYGVGSQLLEVGPSPTNGLTARSVWKSNRMKAKFSNLVMREGFLYGLDDGVLACVDLQDGTLKWKEGRYGHGQGLLIQDLYLLMAENGELVLLRPTPEGPNELGRFRVFAEKTWNPIALSGSLLLVRNDREAACLRLPLFLP
jgi:outer membrane protein assembly factor BamB